MSERKLSNRAVKKILVREEKKRYNSENNEEEKKKHDKCKNLKEVYYGWMEKNHRGERYKVLVREKQAISSEVRSYKSYRLS